MDTLIKNIILFLLFVIAVDSKAELTSHFNHPDSAYIFAYSVNEGRSGLTLAWSIDQEDWHAIGPEHTFLFSDFGRWGRQKRMFSPYLFQDSNKVWHCVWSLNDDVQQFAHATSTNLYEWEPQSYPIVMDPPGNIIDLEVIENEDDFQISWYCDVEGQIGYYSVTTNNFKEYSDVTRWNATPRLNKRTKVLINGQEYEGIIQPIAWEQVEALIKHQEWVQFHNMERAEVMADDPERFKDLEPVSVEIKPFPEKTKEISDKLIGIFFEDISYAADGGIYAELIQNRDFEYEVSEQEYRDPSWNAKYAWSTKGNVSFDIDSIDPIHPNNNQYAIVNFTGKGSFLNEGWDGIPVEKSKLYDFSVFCRGKKNTLVVQLIDKNNKVVGETIIEVGGEGWNKYESVITCKKSDDSTRLAISTQQPGEIHLDMISLFPQHTYKNRKNGLRADLAQIIADMNPRFVRFPGGCVAHGDGLANMYLWENTIGPLESRVPQKNIWRYHQTAGLGYFEYFQFCEDIGAIPIPVVPAGVPCQNSFTGGHGQQCGIPMEEMDAYVQSVLDLIEWANGDPTSEWGSKRAAAGHPEPFNLKYLGVGNEDLITDIFEERFKMIYDAIQEKYPDIVVIGTVGPFYMGSDYEAGWDLARELEIPMVDEHYYQPPGWFINNQDFYDKYDRQGSKVYLGEYAAHVRGRRMNIETALSEAIYLMSLERNGDIVEMASFAPLLAKENYTRWNPDLIYFNNTEVKPTVDYFVQKLYGNNAGTLYTPHTMKLSDQHQEVKERIGASLVTDEKNNDLIIKLANLLPQVAPTTIDLSAYHLADKGTLIILQGDPADENARPVSTDIKIGKELKFELPPYSFVVIRVSMQ